LVYFLLLARYVCTRQKKKQPTRADEKRNIYIVCG
jgi:hypothetical protein